MPLANLKVSAKLGIGFFTLVILGLLQAVYGGLSLHGMVADLAAITDQRMVGIDRLNEAKDNINVVARAIRNMALLPDAGEVAAEARRIDDADAKIRQLFDELTAAAETDAERSAIAEIAVAAAPYRAAIDRVKSLALANHGAEAATALVGEVRPLQAQFFKRVDAAASLQRELARQMGQQAREDVNRATQRLAVISLVAAVLGGLLAVLISRQLTAQLGGEPREVVAAANAIAQGDLSLRSPSGHEREGSIMAAMRAMNQHLAELVGRVRTSSDAIAASSQQVATGSQDLSHRTEEQASNLQQSAASMEQLASTVKSNADTTLQANQLAAQAAQAASQGGDVVGTVVATMREIAESSRKIADIISVIDSIAFQTNILALNAAVEAARAGEQGRGFAVVASEVRALAGRCAEAAREIKSLIGTSVEKFEAGARQVDTAGSTMDGIVAQVRHVTQLLNEISNATVEQSAGIGQIRDAMLQLDHVTQQNATLVEESASAAANLNQQAAELTQLMAVFKLG